MTTITIPKKLIKDDLVIIPRKEYEKLWQWKKEIEDALTKINRGRQELKEGRTYKVGSPKELLKK